MPIVSIFGGSALDSTSPGYREALSLGRLLAQAGYTVATGGYDGVMEAANRGAREAGGSTIGVTTSHFSERKLGPNAWIDQEVTFPTLFQRLHHLVTFSHALVALRGGVGTLSEVALAWSLMQVAEMPCKPFVLVGPEWRRVLSIYQQESTIKSRDLDLISFAPSVETVVPLIQAFRPPR
jgi:uncharacterized protein (TIGR00730 family)